MLIVLPISENTDLKKWLTDKAEKENIKMSVVIRNILNEYMKKNDG